MIINLVIKFISVCKILNFYFSFFFYTPFSTRYDNDTTITTKHNVAAAATVIFLHRERFVHTAMTEYGDWDDKDLSVFNVNCWCIKSVTS